MLRVLKVVVVVESRELHHARRIVIAEQQHDLLGVVAREPAQDLEPLGRGDSGIAQVVVEVVADRDQHHVIGQAIAAERLVRIEHLEHLRKRCLGIAYHERARHFA